ncbi:MAG: hypothetical protein ABW135_14495, partial [Thermoleophilaceae bacterium]
IARSSPTVTRTSRDTVRAWCGDAELTDTTFGEAVIDAHGTLLRAWNFRLAVVPEEVGSSGPPWRLRAAKRLSPKEDTG